MNSIISYYAGDMILSFLQTKGGTAKTTLAKCLAYSKTFDNTFESICLVELDPQGTILAWQAQRENGNDEKVGVAPLYDRDEGQMANTLENLMERYETLILDVPGESLGKFTTRFAASLSDLVLIPMRSSTNDEQSFVDHIYPILSQMLQSDPTKFGSFHIVPTFVHPQSRPENIAGYFREVMPEDVGCLDVFFPYRSVYENFTREGMNLHEYAHSVRKNSRQYAQANRAIEDVERIAENILRLIS
jgi:cellulose biosynthesis protein BcsQ